LAYSLGDNSIHCQAGKSENTLKQIKLVIAAACETKKQLT